MTATLAIASAATGVAATPAVGALAHVLQDRPAPWPAIRWAVLGVGCAVAAVAASRLGVPPAVAFAGMLAVALTAGAVDAAERRLPDPLTWTVLIGGAAALTLISLTTGQGSLGRAALGAAAYGGWMLVGAVAVPHGYGLGDVKLAAGLGGWLAWQSWQALAVGLLAGQILITAALLAGRFRDQSETALGPAIVAGAIIGLL